MDQPNPPADVEEYIEHAVRFYVAVFANGVEESRTATTSKEEMVISHFLRFMRRADPDLRAVVTHTMELWRKKERLD